MGPLAGLPPAAEDAGFTLLGEAEGSGNAAFVGDVQDTTGAAAAADDDDDDDGMIMGFAAAPTGEEPNQDEMMGFAAAPVADNDGGEPPAIILGAPAPGDDDDVVGVVDDASVDAEEPIVEKIPSAMKKFNADFQDTLVQRKEEEEQANVAMAEAARVYMEEFQANRDSKMALNREDEQAKLESIEADLENDNSWQRVTNTVELTQDTAEDSTQRMRDIFILLKNEPGLAAKVGA